ncbi:hypothetical protein ABH900_000517 [Stenotrophomonas sp. AN71]|uniref:hypothetical protein n=1 Tax=Stenotrophomonas sp. AN71 TaxID=3156253 RepID=UPI003D24527E
MHRVGEAEVDAECAYLLACIPDNGMVVSLLEGILKSPNVLAGLSRESYWHPLGFIKIVLPPLHQGLIYRLHYWPPSSSFAEDVHSHRSDFASRVVDGKLVVNRYELVAGNSSSLISYQSMPSGEVSARFVGTTDVREISSKIYEHGGAYFCSRDELHRVIVSDGGAVTISVWDVRTVPAIVVKGAGDPVDTCCGRGECSEMEIREVLSDVISRMQNRDHRPR